MRDLCDSNVWLAVAAEAHPHHARAIEWLEGLAGDDRIAFCRATQISFLRLLRVREVMGANLCTNNEAIKIFRALRLDDRVEFAEEPEGLEE